MSRDFTPREMHEVDTLYGFSENVLKTTSSLTGEEVKLYDPDALVSGRYPNLSFLFSGGLRDILDEYKDAALETLDLVEKRLATVVATDTGSGDDPLYLWYTGKLDPRFYYRETNDELFREYIVTLVGDASGRKEEVYGQTD